MIAFIEAQGGLLAMRIQKADKPVPIVPAKRGTVVGFSAAARRRLLRFLARLETHGVRATFLTLTFTAKETNENAKTAFKRFVMRLRRHAPGASAVWRMELQPKRGAIHFHLLVFNLPYWSQAEVQRAWEACTGEAMSIVDIRLVRGHKAVMNYVSKYIAVREKGVSTSLDDVSYQHAPRDELVGRCWGWVNKDALPLGELIQGVLTGTLTIKALSDFAWSIVGTDNRYGSLSFHLFTDQANDLFAWAVEQAGLWWDDWRNGAVENSIYYPAQRGSVGSFVHLNQ